MKKNHLIILVVMVIGIIFVFPSNEQRKVEVKNNSYMEANVEIQEESYFIDNGFIQPIALKTLRSNFLNGFKATSGSLNLSCANEGNYVGTGCFLETILNNDKTSSYEVIAYGDVTGDGLGTITDIVKMVMYSKKSVGINGNANKIAADIDYDSKISEDDAITLAAHLHDAVPIPTPTSKNVSTKIELSSTSIAIEKNSTKKVFATTNKGDVAIVDWKSNNPAIATVDSTGLITGIGGGTTTITVSAKDGTTRSLNVSVSVPVSGISLSSTSLSLEKGKKASLKATISPSDATNKGVVWSSSNSKVATVDQNGNVVAVSAGTAIITAKLADGSVKAEASVEVKDFLGLVDTIWKKIASGGFTYDGVNAKSIPITGTTIDCSAFVSWVLYEYGYEDFKGSQKSTLMFLNTNYTDLYGWEEINVSAGEDVTSKLKPGDILVRDNGSGGAYGHMNIVAKVENGVVYAYDCGNANNWNNSGGEPIVITNFVKSDSRAGKIIRII
ncbi:MAG: Ig-like domain-containing protein [Bacilli bacterium]|nr:Ig-like domain-containing protein [Bacilli bacterium]